MCATVEDTKKNENKYSQTVGGRFDWILVLKMLLRVTRTRHAALTDWPNNNNQSLFSLFSSALKPTIESHAFEFILIHVASSTDAV